MSKATVGTAGRATLEELQERFVLHWGEMASAWGINRTMGQIHALLYVSPEPLTTDEVMARLHISRGNASTNLRALEDWGVVERLHVKNDRRERFRSLTDVWELFHTIIRERKRREFDPMMRSLRRFLEESAASRDDGQSEHFHQRLAALVSQMELLQSTWDRLIPDDPRDLPRLLEIDVQGLD